MYGDRSNGRAQTTVDFAIAMGVFLIALTTVIAFMPTMIQPFTGGQENPMVADRVATQLIDGQIGTPGEPSMLNVTCTMYFFNGSSGDPCPSFDNSEPLQEKVGLAETRFINITLQKNVSGGPDPEPVCASGDGTVSAPPCGGLDFMAVGSDPPQQTGSVTVARRVGLFDDALVYVVVKVWS